MDHAFIRFLLGAVALMLIIDVMLRLIYWVRAKSERNRLLDEYADVPSDDSPPGIVRIGGLAVSVILNLLIYFIL